MDVDVIIIGAGAVGLAVAAEFARAGHDVIVLEAADGIGTQTSSRNSEVIHGGMYYPTGSLRHRMCVDGRRKLYAYLDARGVTYQKRGKLIVATSDTETRKIEAIHATGQKNDVENLELISGGQALAWEPELRCTAALWSPETGIVDSHGYMLALQGEIEDHGGLIAFNTPVVRITPLAAGGYEVATGGEEPGAITGRRLINSAGLYAQSIAHSIEGYDTTLIPKLVLAKGNYFGCAAKPVFSRLIYPAPVEGGLGVHVTLDLAGRMRFGPDVEWLSTTNPAEVDYRVDPKRSALFYDAIRSYWPGLPDNAITPDYSGCRPKLSGPGEPAQDFRIDGPELHGHAGLVNLFGIESPGLTSSLAIAEEVRRRLAN
ncbi:MAG: NAD(P)/FAD-dependent oxidoreductase [Burkholderiales bacterium]|nr:MAG: NAD(P)/FAD-dependent oxidoreductase [Burkholderiales bacterium]